MADTRRRIARPADHAVLRVTETSIQGVAILPSFPMPQATVMTLLIPPRERTASRALSRGTRAVTRARTAAGKRRINDARSCTPSSKRGAACIDGAAEDLVVEDEITHDAFCIDSDRRPDSRDTGEDKDTVHPEHTQHLKGDLGGAVASYTRLMLPMIFVRSAGGCSAEEMNRAPMADTILTFGLSALSREYTQVLNLPSTNFIAPNSPMGPAPRTTALS